MDPIIFTDCLKYVEDPCITDSTGESKGQCRECGSKWFEHKLGALPADELASAYHIQKERGIHHVTLSDDEFKALVAILGSITE